MIGILFYVLEKYILLKLFNDFFFFIKYYHF
jgi:hypothetical protein